MFYSFNIPICIIEKHIEQINLRWAEIMNLSKDKLLTLVSDKLLQALKNQDRGEDGQLEDNLFTPR